MHPKEEEQFIPGAIEAMRRLNLAAGEAQSLRQLTCRVRAKDVSLVVSAAKKISGELLKYRVTSPQPASEALL